MLPILPLEAPLSLVSAHGCAAKVASLVEIDVIGGILASSLRQVKPRVL